MKIYIEINRPHWNQSWSRKRTLLISLALLLITPVVVTATNSFNDVPDDHPFHDAVEAIFGARITTGCGGGNYCPDDPVTRGQMAAFMGRGFSRVAYGEGFVEIGDSDTDVAVLTINTGGGATGGNGFLKVDASFTLSVLGSGCPCDISFHLHRDNGGDSETYYLSINNYTQGFDRLVGGRSSGAVTSVFFAPTATVQTMRLKARREGSVGSAAIFARAEITAIYVPFGSTGGNAI